MSDHEQPEPAVYPRGTVDREFRAAIDRPEDRNDLLRPDKTQQAMVNALGWEHDHGAPPLTITSINSSHHDDSGLSMSPSAPRGAHNHGHTNGFSIDVVLNDPRDLDKFLDTLSKNPYVTKIGLGGQYYTKDALRHITPDHPAFHDNDQTHVHFQTTDSGNRAPTPEVTVAAAVHASNAARSTDKLPEPRDVQHWDGKRHFGTMLRLDADTYAMHVGRGSYQTFDVQHDLHGKHPVDGRKAEIDGHGKLVEDRTIVPQQSR